MNIKLNNGGSFNVLDHSGNSLLSAVDGQGNIAFDFEETSTYGNLIPLEKATSLYNYISQHAGALIKLPDGIAIGYAGGPNNKYVGLTVYRNQSCAVFPWYYDTPEADWVASRSNELLLAYTPNGSTEQWDTTPTSGSTKPVTSGGIFDALAGKIAFDGELEVRTDSFGKSIIPSAGVYLLKENSANVGIAITKIEYVEDYDNNCWLTTAIYRNKLYQGIVPTSSGDFSFDDTRDANKKYYRHKVDIDAGYYGISVVIVNSSPTPITTVSSVLNYTNDCFDVQCIDYDGDPYGIAYLEYDRTADAWAIATRAWNNLSTVVLHQVDDISDTVTTL